MNRLVLSLFSGIDLFGKGFTNNNFCVVSAGDKFLGSDIRDFNPPSGFCDGVIGGSPCQDFSRLNRDPKEYSFEMLNEFIRVVQNVKPFWFLHENVVGVPEFEVEGYVIQRFELDLSWFNPIASRRRIFTFGFRCDAPGEYLLNPIIKNNPPTTYRAVTCQDSLSLKEMAQIQGCDFVDELEHFSVKGKKTVIGNAVPLVMSQYLAEIIDLAIYQSVTTPGEKCNCGCGRVVEGKAKHAHQNCRKKASRKRDTAASKCDAPV
jgi:DNA (cytosine-5)-methyltransferase 1